MKPHYDIPNDLGAIKDRDILEGYSSDPLHVAMPDALVRPQSVEEVSRILSYCHSHGIPVTPCGNQTSLTAAAIADHGILMSSEKLESGWRIHEDPEQPGRWLAYVGAAANLAAFQDSIAAQGFFTLLTLLVVKRFWWARPLRPMHQARIHSSTGPPDAGCVDFNTCVRMEKSDV